MTTKHNIIFHQLQIDSTGKSIIEVAPNFSGIEPLQLTIAPNGNLTWDITNPLDLKHRLRNTNLYFKNGTIGIGRLPLHENKLDIESSIDQLETIIHIGDGSVGFSMGNGTSQGFIPEIIGMGYDENDAGLYFMGKTQSDKPSNIPLVIIGGLSPKNNRPILGITSGIYDQYDVLIDQGGMVTVNDLKLKGSISMREMIKIIEDQQDTINQLVDRINDIQKDLQ
jgi:hypothetical protein